MFETLVRCNLLWVSWDVVVLHPVSWVGGGLSEASVVQVTHTKHMFRELVWLPVGRCASPSRLVLRWRRLGEGGQRVGE